MCNFKIEDWANCLIKNVHIDITKKLESIWPYKDWPAESIISSSLIMDKSTGVTFDVYPEVSINGGRIDILLINHVIRLMIHVEVKKMDGKFFHKICDDLDRFTKVTPSINDIYTIDRRKQHVYSEYKKYGLFLGISSDDCWTAYDWWLLPINSISNLVGYKLDHANKIKNDKTTIDRLKESYNKNNRRKTWGCYPSVKENSMKDNSLEIALCYALFDLN